MARLAHADLDELRGFLRAAADFDGVAAFDDGVRDGLAWLVPCDEADAHGLSRPVPGGDWHADVVHPPGRPWELDVPLGSTEVALTRTARTFSLRDRDVLDVARPALLHARDTCAARERTAGHAIELDAAGEVVRADPLAADLLVDAFGPPDHPTWLPPLVKDWLATPPRPPLHARGVVVRLLPGPPHLLLVERDQRTAVGRVQVS